MPLYEYICKKCRHQFELLVRGSTTPTCPKCNSKSLDKLLSTFAVSTNGGVAAREASAGPCGTCGDPRGPGACAWDN
jgi:putative FmdB family regulatory protein